MKYHDVFIPLLGDLSIVSSLSSSRVRNSVILFTDIDTLISEDTTLGNMFIGNLQNSENLCCIQYNHDTKRWKGRDRWPHAHNQCMYLVSKAIKYYVSSKCIRIEYTIGIITSMLSLAYFRTAQSKKFLPHDIKK